MNYVDLHARELYRRPDVNYADLSLCEFYNLAFGFVSFLLRYFLLALQQCFVRSLVRCDARGSSVGSVTYATFLEL